VWSKPHPSFFVISKSTFFSSTSSSAMATVEVPQNLQNSVWILLGFVSDSSIQFNVTDATESSVSQSHPS
jgi:hypothetical protein